MGTKELSETAENNSTQPQALPIEQISNDLNTWLSERGVTLVVVAIGNRTGQPCAIDDFLPTSHTASITLAKVQ